MGKYQIRIRKPLPVDQLPKVFDALAALGGGTAMQIETITTNEEMGLQETIDRVKAAAPEYEIISIILVDTDNSDLFDDDFDWDGV